MNFSLRVPVNPFWFHTLYPATNTEDPYYLITQQEIDSGQNLFVESHPQGLKAGTYFAVGHVTINDYYSQGGRPVGFLLHSQHQSRCLSSAVLAYAPSNTEEPVNIETRLVMRTPLFFLYHSKNKATLATNPNINPRIHDALTAV